MATKTLIILFALIGLFVFFLPQTSWCKTTLEKAISKQLSTQAIIDRAHFSWGGPQILSETQTSFKNLDISAEKIAIEESLITTLFGKSHVRIEEAKIKLDNENSLNFLLSLRKPKYETLILTFSEMNLTYHKGAIALKPSDVWVNDSFRLSLKGTLNTSDNEIDMILGLTAQSLKKAFGLKGLPENYLLEVPIKGSLEKPKFDLNGATTKVTALLLWQQLNKKEFLADITGN